ncbi:MAG: molybdopterin molybdenumtransferase MoeA, partial [Alphaproteobacteria bacterium]|nr:molybdopterin molybdenumtransferase MoeA [Alphaproteobacteria bacterium]
TLVCAMLFVRPAISALLGTTAHQETITAVLSGELPENDSRQDYVRATLRIVEGKPLAQPLARQDSSHLSGFAKAGCLIVRAPHAPAAHSGDRIEVLPLD